MTAYKNFVDDFPRRCQDILRFAGRRASFGGREVTLSLMVASAGLIIPYERLKPGEFDHPSGDNINFSDAADQLRNLLKQRFLSSAVWNAPVSTWQSGILESVLGDPDSWDGLHNRVQLRADKKVKEIIGVIRNALAHGNIFTFNNPIDAIIFLSRVDYKDVKKGYSFIYVSPGDFTMFLEKWFDFLDQLHIPQTEAYEVLKDAA